MGWSRTIWAAFGASSLIVVLATCGPSGNGGGHAGHALFGMHHAFPLMNRALRLGLRGARERGGFRRACEADIARLCANARTRRDERDCLEDKRESLSADCRTALDTRRRRNEESR